MRKKREKKLKKQNKIVSILNDQKGKTRQFNFDMIIKIKKY